MVCYEAKSAPSGVKHEDLCLWLGGTYCFRHEYLCLWLSDTCGGGSRAGVLACEYACDGARTHAARWSPWIIHGIDTSREETEQNSQEIVKLAVFVVGGLTALCWCAWRRRRDACQTCRDIDGAKALAEEMQQESWHLMKLVVVGLDGSWDCGGVSGEGEEMFVKLTASTAAATPA